MITLAEKASIVHDHLRGQRSIRLVSNGIHVGRTAALCRNILKGQTIKDAQVQAAREHAVDRLYSMIEQRVDLGIFTGKELDFNDKEHCPSELDPEIMGLNEKTSLFTRAKYELIYWTHTYNRRFNAISGFISYGIGDALAMYIRNDWNPSAIKWSFVGGMMVVGAYYSQEIPFVLNLITKNISAETRKGRLARWGLSMFVYDPLVFVPRHVVIANLLCGNGLLGLGEAFKKAFTIWLLALPLTGPYDYAVVNRINPKYRFIAIELMNIAWSTWAALVSLAGISFFK